MVDSVVTKQELIDAQKDAQSLEDVINGPADTRVKPRIGPEMWTLATINSLVQQGQIKISDLSEAIQIALAAGAGSAGWTANLVADGNQTQKEINLYGGKKYDMPVGGYPVNAVVRLENGDIVKSTVANNTNNPNVNMTGWVNPSTTIKTLDYFGGSIERASDWVKQSTSNFVEIPPKEFTLSRPIQYFNRFICRVGRAKINVPTTTDLDYGYIASGEVLHIDGVDFYIEGHRLGVDANSYNRVFMTNYVNYPCISVHLKNINVYGMKGGSYVDDVGKTRCVGFIGFSVRERQEIQHIKTFGLRIFCDAISSSPNATHDDFDVICVNAETCLYYQPATWLAGSVKNIKLINTATEQTYFIGMNAGINNNGKDAVMNAATYTVPLVVDDIYAKRAIERSIYIQSPTAQVSNIVDEESYSAGHTKINLVDAPIGRVKLSGITAKNPTSLGTVFQTYGLAELGVANLDISFESNLSARAVVVANTGDFTLRDSKIKNVATVLYYTGVGSVSTKSINVHNLETVNCVSNVVPFVYDRSSTGGLDKLSIKNSSFEISKDTVAIYSLAMDCTNVKSLDISESSFDISRSLFRYSATTTEIKLNDVVLNVRTLSTVADIYAALLNPAWYPVSANIFDITYNIDSRHATTLDVKTQIHCSKTTNTGIVRCLDYWDVVNIEIPVVAGVPSAYYLMSFGAVSYFAEVSFAGSLLRYYYDAALNTITEQVNVGGKLGTSARNASKISLSVAQANNYRLDIDVGQTTWIGGGGDLKLRIYR